MARIGSFRPTRRNPLREWQVRRGVCLAATFVCALCVPNPAVHARQPAAGVAAPPPAPVVESSASADSPPPAAVPQEISIGEPVSLPNAAPLAAPFPKPISGGDLKPAPMIESVVAPAVPRTTVPGVGLAPASAATATAAQAGNGWLGFSVDDSVVTGRLVVVEVAPGGPAARAGIQPRDVLLSLNGTQLHTSDELAATLAAIGPGQRVTMSVGRDNRLEEIVAEATTRPAPAVSPPWQASATAEPAVPPLAAAPTMVPPSVGPGGFAAVEPPAAARLAAPAPLPPRVLAPSPVSGPAPAPVPSVVQPALSAQHTGRTALGVRTVPVDPAVQNRFHLSDRSGAFVIGVVQDLPAAKAGVPPGSVIVAINHQPVRSPQDLTQLVTRGPVGTPVPLEYVLPGGAAKHADVVLQSLELPLERALVGDEAAAAATADQPARVARRFQRPDEGVPKAVHPLEKLEDLLSRLNAMNERLEQIERRLDQAVPAR